MKTNTPTAQKSLFPRGSAQAGQSDVCFIILFQGIMDILEYYKEYSDTIPCADDTFAGSLGADLSDKKVIKRRIAVIENDISVIEKLSHGVIDKEDKNYLPVTVRDSEAGEKTSETSMDMEGTPMTYRKDNPVNVASEIKGKSRGDIKVTGLSGISPQPAISRKLRNLGSWKHSLDKKVDSESKARKLYRDNQKSLNRFRITRCICKSLQIENFGVDHNRDRGIRLYFCKTCNSSYIAVANMTEVRKLSQQTEMTYNSKGKLVRIDQVRGVIHPKYSDVRLVTGKVKKISLNGDTLEVLGVQLNLKELMKL